MQTVLATLQIVTATGAAAFWALGMYCWWLLNHASEPRRAQRRRRTIHSFVVMGLLGLTAFGLRVLKESVV